jgi:DNA-binding NtrC family response regulator
MIIKNKIVSIVDDESSTVNLFYNALKAINGIKIFKFTDPIKALEHLKMNKEDYAAMISDLRMPVINGVQLLKTVKDLNPITRTILITAYYLDDNLLQEYIKKEIINSFIQKPIGVDQLRLLVSNQICSV